MCAVEGAVVEMREMIADLDNTVIHNSTVFACRSVITDTDSFMT